MQRLTVVTLALIGLSALTTIMPYYAATSLQASQKGQPAAVKPIGTIRSIEGNWISLSTDAGPRVSVTVQDSTRLIRIAPGQKNLKDATPVRLQDLQVGDRILVGGGKPAEDGKSIRASSIIVMKQGEIEQKRHQEQEDWQKRGTGGLVTAVDPATRTITVRTSGTNGIRTVTIHISQDTVLRRYASDSVRFSDAKPGTLDEIKPGDQLRARGSTSADGQELKAEEIVSGSFRNIAGTVASVDAGGNELSVFDLSTKKPVVVKIKVDSRMLKLPPQMAQAIAAHLKGAGTGHSTEGERPSSAGAAAGRESRATAPDIHRSIERAPGDRGPAAATDLQQALNHLPAAKLSDLQKGEAVMIVSTQGSTADEVTAITLLSGVEPIMMASSSETQPMLLSPWSLSAPAGD